MSDPQLLAFGCAITFLAAGGAYVAMREQYLDAVRVRVQERARRRSSARGTR